MLLVIGKNLINFINNAYEFIICVLMKFLFLLPDMRFVPLKTPAVRIDANLAISKPVTRYEPPVNGGPRNLSPFAIMEP